MDSSVTRVKAHNQLQIPARRQQQQRTPKATKHQKFRNATLYGKLCNIGRKQLGWPTKDQLRWPIQAGIAGGIAFLCLAGFDAMANFFSQTALLGLVLTPLSLEATAGGSLRRGLLYMGAVAILSFFGYGLFAASTLNGTVIEEWYACVLMSISATILPIPVCLLRYFYPGLTIGLGLGLSISENILLGNISLQYPESAWVYAFKRCLAVIVATLSTIVVAHSILVKAARPTAANSLATILLTMAEILDPLAGLNTEKIDGFTSSSALLLTPYPQLLASTKRFLYDLDSHQDNSQQTQDTRDPVSQEDSSSLEDNGITKQASSSRGLSNCMLRGSSILESLEPDKKECERMMESIKKCQNLLNAQKELIVAASQELSCKKPYLFQKKKYNAVLAEVRTLFFHISFLVYTINLYISTVEYQLKACEPMERDTIILKAKSRFNIFRAKSQPTRRCHSEHFGRMNDYNFRDFRCSQSPLSFSPRFHNSYLDNSFPEIDIYAYGGCELHKVAQHLVKALRLMADCLIDRKKTSDAAKKQVQLICENIQIMDDQRRQQREKFAEIIFTTLEADVTGVWNKNNNTQLDWRGAIFLDAKDLLPMTREEKLLYWEAYWLGRDRASTSEHILHTLKDSLVRLCGLIDSYIALALVSDATVLSVVP